MTESEWLDRTDPPAMVSPDGPAGRLTDRKARLLASALCRRAWSFLIDKRSQGAVETAEQYADGLAPELRREAAELEAERAIVGIRGHSARWWAATAAFMTAGDRPPLREVVMHTDDHLNRPTQAEAGRAAQARLIQDLLGNPFRSVILDRSAMTPLVASLAEAAYENRSLPSGHLDKARLAVLSDALEESGVTGEVLDTSAPRASCAGLLGPRSRAGEDVSRDGGGVPGFDPPGGPLQLRQEAGPAGTVGRRASGRRTARERPRADGLRRRPAGGAAAVLAAAGVGAGGAGRSAAGAGRGQGGQKEEAGDCGLPAGVGRMPGGKKHEGRIKRPGTAGQRFSPTKVNPPCLAGPRAAHGVRARRVDPSSSGPLLEGPVRNHSPDSVMTVELQIAILGVVVAAVIGAWQIYLARKQVQASEETALRTGSIPRAAEPPGDSANLLHRLWDSFEPELQDALSVAYNQAKREGKTRISTRTFFAAVARLRPGQLPGFLDRLPEDALPEPISEDVPREGSILREDPQLSTCVESALSHLGKKADPHRKLSAAEVFVDVAKHGTGPSVAHLRERGITPEKIDRLVEELGWEVRER